MMSKKDTVTDIPTINHVLDQCETIHLGLRDGERVYVVPVHFAYEEHQGHYTFYFHGGPHGRRYELVKKTHYAAFELNSGQQLQDGGSVACNWSANYASVLGEGHVDLLESNQDKLAALKLMMKQYAGRTDFEFPEEHLQYVQVYKLTATELSCRVHRKK